MYYNSAMNYDMINAQPWNNMNLHMNQLMSDSIVRSNMYNVPLYDYSNCMPYPSMVGNSFLTNPFYTLNQMTWGTPMWNNNNWSMNPNTWGGNTWSQWGWNGSTTVTPPSSDKGDSTTNRKYNRLLSLVKQLAKYDGLSASQQDILNDAMKNTKGTAEEKFDRLMEAYKEIDKDIVREFLVEGAHKLGVSKDIKGSENDDSFFKRLLDAGFEYEDIGIDDDIDQFYDGIKELKGSDGTDKNIEGIIGDLEIGTHDILDFISSWNNNYKNDTDASRVIDHIAKYYDEIDDEDAKKTAKSAILKPFVQTLVDKANSVKKSLDTDSKKAIEDAIQDVRDALNNSESSVDSNLSGAFDTLYLLTRQGAMAEFRNDAKTFYGEIDSVVFTDDLFDTDVIDDLKAEGFSDEQIRNSAVSISERKARRSRSEGASDDDDESGSRRSSADPFKGIDNKRASEQVAILVSNDVLTPSSYKLADGTVVYIEEKASGDSDGDKKADYARLFYINAEGKLVEWENTKLVNGQPTIIDTNKGQEAKEIDASKVVSAKRNTEKTEEKEEKETAEHADAKSNGSYIATNLNGATEDYVYKKVNEKISSKHLNKNNVIDFVDGYYNNNSNKWLRHKEGLIEFLDDEYDNGAITMSNKKNIIKSFLNNEEVLKFKNTPEYEQLQHLLEKYDGSDKKTFNHGGFNRAINFTNKTSAGFTYGGAALLTGCAGTAWAIGASNFWNPVGWGALAVGACATAYGLLDSKTDNEVIDDCMKALYDKVIDARQGA